MTFSLWNGMVIPVMGLGEAGWGVWLLLATLGTVFARSSPYTSQWAVHIEGGPDVAAAIGEKHGFTLVAEIFPDLYHFEHRKVAKRSLQPSTEHHENLLSEKQVKWAKQQRVRRRKKRDYLTMKDIGVSSNGHVFLNDPRWPLMWYLNRGNGLDMSVEGAWKEGITGKGVVVTILDDGLEKDHPDLIANYDPDASFDVNNHDENPMPRYDILDSNRHGTRCAGEVAAVANNSLCSIGIAYGASVGGVRMLDGDVTDVVEARSLSLNPQHIDIYSASWGPDDDGKTVDGPGELATRAFIEGVTKGRSGKGSIFVWASGNGGKDSDNCNCDGYTNSIWTLSISSATENGLVPWYSEACSSTLATTYSSGSNDEKQVVTTDLHHMCTNSHTGTSASAPLAAGICALALEANPNLTWRDMQHIVVATAKPANLKASDWTTNGVGRNVSHSFGFGLMDAAAMVKLSRTWRTVPEQKKCTVTAPHQDKVIPAKSSITLQLNVKECPGVYYLEHVQAKVSLFSQRRGDIQIMLTSPSKTKTTLLAKRTHDVSRQGFKNWPFMSVHTWGENPLGAWMLEIHNEGRYYAKLKEWQLVFYGTETAPNEQTTSKSDISSTNKAQVQPSSPQSSSAGVQSGKPSGGAVVNFVGDELLKSDIPDDSVSISGCQRTSQTCLECKSDYFFWNGLCETVCPGGTYPVSGGACDPCHYSCLHCSGPGDGQCTLCHPDGFLFKTNSEAYCYPKSLLPSISYTKWYSWIFFGLIVNIFLLVASGLVMYLRQKGCRCRRGPLKSSDGAGSAPTGYELAESGSDTEC